MPPNSSIRWTMKAMAEAMLRILDRARRGAGVGRTRVPPRQAVFVARER